MRSESARPSADAVRSIAGGRRAQARNDLYPLASGCSVGLLRRDKRRTVLQIRIDQVFDHLLPPAAVRGGVAFFEHDFFERLETVLAGLDFFAESSVPTGVA